MCYSSAQHWFHDRNFITFLIPVSTTLFITYLFKMSLKLYLHITSSFILKCSEKARRVVQTTGLKLTFR